MCFEDSGPQFAIANFTGRRSLVAAGADDGLFDFPARQYSAYQGRWLTPDPAGAAAAGLRSAQILRICLADPRTWNEYAYVGNQPLSATDPLGLDAGGETCGGILGGPQSCTPFAGNGGMAPPNYQEEFQMAIMQLIWDSAIHGIGTGNWYAPFFPSAPGGNGGGVPAAATAQPAAPAPANPKKCAAALRTAGQDQSAVARADAAWAILAGAAAADGIAPALLAPIGVRESGFQNVLEKDGAGKGVGVFQITVTGGRGPTAAQAGNLAWAANYAAAMLRGNSRTLANEFPGLTAAQLLQATAASYHIGADQIWGNPARIDAGTAHGNYGSNVIDLMNCF